MKKITMQRFDINLFIEKAKSMDYFELLKLSQNEAIEINKISFTSKSPFKKYELEIKQFREFLSGLNFILINGVSSNSINQENFQSIKPIFENFVERGQWEIESLKIFEQ